MLDVNADEKLRFSVFHCPFFVKTLLYSHIFHKRLAEIVPLTATSIIWFGLQPPPQAESA